MDAFAARDALLARTRAVGLVLTVLVGAATGGVAGLLARTDAADPAPPDAATATPRPLRTVYVPVPAGVRPAPAPARPPQRTRQAPVTVSDAS